MARQCCRDSATMWVVAHDETEGDLVPCRWGCEGYARYEGGKWHYAEDESVERRHATQAELLTNPYRQQRIADVLGKPLLPCHTLRPSTRDRAVRQSVSGVYAGLRAVTRITESRTAGDARGSRDGDRSRARQTVA